MKASTAAQMKALAADLGFAMGEADLAAFGELMRPSVDACNAVDRMAQELPPASLKPGKLSSVRGLVVPTGW